MKKCKKCGRTLPLVCFRKSRGTPRGTCRECERAEKRRHYHSLKTGTKRPKMKKKLSQKRVCTRCGRVKDLGEFPHNKKDPKNYSDWKSQCKSCCRELQKKRVREGYVRPSSLKKERILVDQRRRSALARGHSFEIGIDHVRQLVSIHGWKCHVTGMPFGKGLLAPSLDRVFGDLDYIPGNVQITSRFYNYAKHSLGDVEFRRILRNPIEEPLDVERSVRELYRLSQRRAESRAHNLTFQNIRDMITKNRDPNGVVRCSVTGMPLVNHPSHPQKISIDRIDNDGGYDASNVQITSLMFNRGRNNHPLEEAVGVYNSIMGSIPEINIMVMPWDNRLPLDKMLEFDLCLFPDEVHSAPIKAIIGNKLRSHKPLSLRPKDCSIKPIDHRAVSEFYDRYHYLGRCACRYHLGALYRGELVACMSIRKPTRQNAGDWEIARMSSSPKYRVHGLWSHMANWVRSNLSGRVVTYSDRRLFSGSVYRYMGFKQEKVLPPDYYWVKDGTRYHKSKLRKSKSERSSGLTERELREAQGFHRVWDLGKIRWVVII